MSELGIGPGREPAFQQAWERGYAAAATYAAEHGHLTPPTGYTTPEGYPLATWLTKQRTLATRGTLTDERRERLNALGMVWNTREAAWWRTYALAEAFHREHGHCDIPQDYRTTDGTRLGAWLATQRGQHKHGNLADDRTHALDRLGIRWRT